MEEVRDIEATSGDSSSGLSRALAPLRSRDYRLLAGALVLAMLTDGMWTLAVVWQVIAMGGGAVQVSLVSGALSVGLVASALFGGVLADRASHRVLLVSLEGLKFAGVIGIGIAAVTGVLTMPTFAAAALLLGFVQGCFYPAYSATVPLLVEESRLLAANGLEGFLRPVALMAIGPALAGVVVMIASPGWAIVVAALASACALPLYAAMRVPPAPRASNEGAHVVARTVRDLAEGFRFMLATPWLLATLLYASLLVLLIMGPIEVLIPFAIVERAGGDAGSHALVLAVFGAGGAIGSLVMASRRMPRRYLTVMLGVWGVAPIPLAVYGLSTSIWAFVAAAFLLGMLFDLPGVLWGSLLQQRVPRQLLGRVSSLDFFVSLVFMPVSMAVSAPLAEVFGLTTVFLVAATVPVPLAVIAWFAAGMRRDELANPLR